MKMPFITPFILSCLAMVNSCTGQTQSNKQIWKVVNTSLRTESPDSSFMLLTNTGKEDAHFSLKVNGGFYLTEKDQLSQIRSLPEEYRNEPLERKAWRYVGAKVKFSKAITDQTWPHAPALMVNSVANGQCDDLASSLHLLWQGLGFESRVWSLEGHVVPEVFVKGRWQMYDPSHQVYYLNDRGEVAGVEELSKHPEWITNPRRIAMLSSTNPVAYALGHSLKIAKTYASDSNNVVNPLYDEHYNLTDSLFVLSPGVSVKFPVIIGDSTASACRSFIKEFSFLTAKVPAGTKAYISFPLALYNISGSGKVNIDGVEYAIGSDKLNILLKDFSVYRNKVSVVAAEEDVELFYLLNPRLLRLQKDNVVSVAGTSVDGLKVLLVKDSAVTLYRSMSSHLDSIIRHAFLTWEKKQDEQSSDVSSLISPASTPENIKARASYFLGLGGKMNAEEKSKRLSVLHQRMDVLFAQLPQGKKRDRVLSALADPYLYIVFINYLEYCNEDVLLKMMTP